MDLFSYLMGKNAGSSDINWSAIGYSSTPESILFDYNYSKDIYDNWDVTQTNLSSKFTNNNYITIMPLVDTSNVTNTAYMFSQSKSLRMVPLLDLSHVTSVSGMFQDCPCLLYVPVFNLPLCKTLTAMFSRCLSLTDESLDNILQMCIGMTSYTGSKKLVSLGISDTTVFPVSRIEALPHYQDFLDAGWTIGY